MHPFGGRLLGWEEVRDSWEQAAQAFSDGRVALDEVVVVPISEDAAYTLGTERGQGKVGEQTVRIDWRYERLPSRSGRMEDGAPPHRLLFGGGASPRHVARPRSESSRAGA